MTRPAIRRRLVTTVAWTALWTTVSAVAHHQLHEFDTTTFIEIEGRVVDFKLMDPHSILIVDVVNHDNTITQWSVEGGSAHGIARAGLTTEFLRTKPFVVITAYPSRSSACSPSCKAAGRDFKFEELEDAEGKQR